MKKLLMNLFKANVKAGPGLVVKSGADEATVYVYDAIGDWYGITASDFVRELNVITAGTIHLRINSPGGDVFEARAMQTALRQHPAKVIAHIDGVAASAATFLALGADEVEIVEGGFFMIHNAWTLGVGDAAELRKTADMLDKVNASIRTDYMQKTGKDEAEITALMDAETWMTAQEALDGGFVDRVFAGKKAENKFNMAGYRNAPAVLTEKTSEAARYDRAEMERRFMLLEIAGR